MAGSPPSDRRPPLYRFVADRSGQSETIGIVLLLAITVIGSSAVIALGSTAITQTRENSQLERTGNALTLLDTRSAMVALGESSIQTIDLGNSEDGRYAFRDSGWIRVEHINHTGDPDDVQNETIYNRSLGELAFEQGETTIAYQGGGVWRQTGEGTTMISPPEFHFRDATLTLPVVRIDGSGEAYGDVTAEIKAEGQRHVFPDAETTGDDGQGAPYDATDRPYENPVENGTVEATVKSEYYLGWASFFRERTSGNVSVDHDAETVTVELVTHSTPSAFQMPQEDNAVEVRGMEGGHPIDDFQVTLSVEKTTNVHFSFYATEGNQEFEIHIYSQKLCDEELDVSVYYYDGTGDEYQGWQNQSIDAETDDNFDVECGGGGQGQGGGGSATLTADFTGDTPLEYREIAFRGSDNKWRFGNEIGSRNLHEGAPLDQHPTVSGEDSGETLDGGETEDTHFVVNHYLSIMGPDTDLTVSEGPGGSDRIDEDTSSGTLEYEQSGDKFITYLHISENEVSIEFQ